MSMPITQSNNPSNCTQLCNKDDEVIMNLMEEMKNGVKSISQVYLDDFLKSQVFFTLFNKIVSQVLNRGAPNGAISEDFGKFTPKSKNLNPALTGNLEIISDISIGDISYSKPGFAETISLENLSKPDDKEKKYEIFNNLSTRMEKLEANVELIGKKLLSLPVNVASSSEKIGAGLSKQLLPSSSEKIGAGLSKQLLPRGPEKPPTGGLEHGRGRRAHPQLEALGPLSLRAAVGHGARGLLPGRRLLGILSPRPRPQPRLSLG